MSGQFEKGMAAPDLMCVCIDRRDTAGSSGRLYSRYTERPQNFVNEYQLLRFMDGLMDAIDYPQSSVEMRSYGKPPIVDKKESRLYISSEEVTGQKGQCATFLVHVQYRQNATWQGEILWKEMGKLQFFRSALEFLKLLDSAQ